MNRVRVRYISWGEQLSLKWEGAKRTQKDRTNTEILQLQHNRMDDDDKVGKAQQSKQRHLWTGDCIVQRNAILLNEMMKRTHSNEYNYEKVQRLKGMPDPGPRDARPCFC
jgi:hypothetical protein